MDLLYFILKNGYNIVPESIKKLEGYDSENFRILANNEMLLVKIFPYPYDEASLETQTKLLNFIEDKPQRFPSIIPQKSGSNFFITEWQSKKYCTLVYTFLEGEMLSQSEIDDNLIADFGSLLGNLDAQLLHFDPGYKVATDSIWDLQHFRKCLVEINYIKDLRLKRIVHYYLNHLELKYDTVKYSLRKSWIHGDANDWNVLVDHGKISGLIDFGDVYYSHLINDPAVALSYLLFNKENPVDVAKKFVAAYHRILALEEIEIALLYYLIAARLCISFTMACKMETLFPDKSYYTISKKGAGDLLLKWIKTNPVKVENEFRKACGFDHSPSIEDNRLKKARQSFLSTTLSLSYDNPIHMVGAAFQYMYDNKGNTYLDCVNNIPHVGHCHPVVVKAGQSKMQVLNTNTRYHYQELTAYSEKLLSYFDQRLNKVFYVNSGSAATDLALRMACNYCKSNKIIAIQNAYHGNTRAAIEVSSYKFDGKGGKGKADNILVIPMPDPIRPSEYDDPQSSFEAIEKFVGGEKPVFISESILGCGGQIELPNNFLKKIYSKIRSLGGVCIADEVQTGFGRVGNQFWSYEYHDVTPDIVILGKPMANGHPMGAVIANQDVIQQFENGMEFFSSFGGNPVSCSIALALLKVIEEENLVNHAREVGSFLKKELTKLKDKYDSIGDVRGRGLFLGIELIKPNTQNEADDLLAHSLINKLKEKGILFSVDGPFHNVIKIKPPLCFDLDNAKTLVQNLDSFLQEPN